MLVNVLFGSVKAHAVQKSITFNLILIYKKEIPAIRHILTVNLLILWALKHFFSLT